MMKGNLNEGTTMETTVLSIDLIVSNPKVRSGRPVIAGTGIQVSIIAAAREIHRHSPDEIASGYGLSLAQVHAALAYYYAHQNEIDEEIRLNDEAIQQAKENGVGQHGKSLLG